MKVYLLLKHPPYPYNARAHLAAAEVVGVYQSRAEPDAIAKQKNSKNPKYLWRVSSKDVK